MRLHRFFVGDIINSFIKEGDRFDISDSDLVHQWKKVFRLKTGDNVILFDGSGFEYVCKIENMSKDSVEISTGTAKKIDPLEREVWVCMSVIKKDNFEWVVEKCTELGVSHFLPIIADRSEKKDLNMDRLKKIAKEASEQCGRGDVPKIHEIITLEESFLYDLPQEKFFFDLNGSDLSEKDLKDKKPVAIFIGPEGGWSEKEVSFFKSKNIETKILGKRVLRAETAAISATSLFLLL